MAKPKVQKIHEEATKFFSKGKWDKALALYSKLTKIEPKEPKNFQKVAELQLKLDMKKQAIATYKEACDIYMSKGFLIQAIAMCKVVIQLAPEEKEMEDRLSELYAKRGISPGAHPPGRPAPAPRRPPTAPARPKPDTTTARPRPTAPPPEPEPAPPQEEPAGIALEPEKDASAEGIIERTSYGAEEDTLPQEHVDSPPVYELDDDAAPEIPLDESDDESLPGIPTDDDQTPMETKTSPQEEIQAQDEISIEDELSLDDEIQPETASAEEEIPPIDDEDEPAEPEPDKVWDISDGLEADTDGGIEIDVMGDMDESEEVVEEETPAEQPVFDLSEEMGKEEVISDLIDEGWEDEEEEAPPAPPSGDALLDESDIEDATFFPEIPLFSDLAQDEFTEVIRKLKSNSFNKNEIIVKEGDEGDSILIVASGRVEVYKEIKGRDPISLATLQEGDFFGEFGYFSLSKRQASVKAVEDCDLLEITREDMENVVRRFPGVESVLEKFYRSRVIENLLATSPLFLDLDADHRSEIASKFKLEEFREGADIVKEGDEGDTMYLIRSGNVQVHTQNPMGEKIILAELGPGDFFGEISLLAGKPRTATVTGASPMVELMSFNKDDLDALIDEVPSIGEKLQEMVEARTEDTVNKVSFLDLDEDDLEIGSLI